MSDRIAFYAAKNRSRRQMESDVECLTDEVRHGAVAVAIAVTRADRITEITWSGRPGVGLTKSLDALVHDIRQHMAEADMTDAVIVRDWKVDYGRPCFRRTDVSVDALFDGLAEGRTLAEIVDRHPTLRMDDVRLALSQAARLLDLCSPDVTVDRE